VGAESAFRVTKMNLEKTCCVGAGVGVGAAQAARSSKDMTKTQFVIDEW
jgi:hypothetical protein